MDKEKKNLLVFGYGLVVLIGVFTVRHGMKHGYGTGAFVALFVAALILCITIFSLPTLKKFYTVWMSVAMKIGHVITTILLVVMFYGIFGLVGIVLRALRKDLLDQKIDLNKRSYWIERKVAAFNKEAYEKQF